jgi:hypothetical protein
MRLLAGAGVVLIVISSSLLFVERSFRSVGSSLVAYPAIVSEHVVVESLHAVGYEAVIGASTLHIPLSDFSRLIDIPVRNALARAPVGDPRRTPLMDHLESRFQLRGPDNEVWNALYVREDKVSAQKGLDAAMEALGIVYAIDVSISVNKAGYLWLPVSVWLTWIVFRKPRGYTLKRILQVIPWLPLLFTPTAESALLVLILGLACTMAGAYLSGDMVGLLAIRLAPMVFSAIALMVLDVSTLPKLGISAGLVLLLQSQAVRIESVSWRKWMHKPPVFKTLTRQGADLSFKPLFVSAIFPALGILVALLAMPSENRNESLHDSDFTIARAGMEGKPDQKFLVASHLAFQRALTYGRLGEAAWGESSYSEAYRYENVDGRIRRKGLAVPAEHSENENIMHEGLNLSFVLEKPPLIGIVKRGVILHESKSGP